MQTTFPMPLGTALRWSAKQAMHLEEEGFGVAVIETVRPMFMAYATSGDYGHMELAQRLLNGER
ncbi:hypothetical protein N9C85_01010 [Synechococcus sp. AH-224-I15]|nr:hypothetical protein [Synechococcus sp. AH-224-I15]